MIEANGPVVRAFASIGWEWGGSWRSLKDYQHFSRNGRWAFSAAASRAPPP